MRPYEVIEERAARARRALVVHGVVAAFAVVPLVRDIAAPDRTGLGDVLVAFLFFAVTALYAGICWISWFKSMYDNVAAAGRARFPTGGVWFWAWVIPGLTLFGPRWLVEDVWWSADPPGERTKPRGRVRAWLALWVVGHALMLVGEWFDDIFVAALVGLVGWALYYIALPFALSTVTALTARVTRPYQPEMA